jgi:hypothetical protein
MKAAIPHRLPPMLAGLTLILLLAVPSPAWAASCRAAIIATEKQLDAVLDRRAKDGPSARETRFARIGRQPTPATIAGAEARLDGWTGGDQAAAALNRARQAQASGRTSKCFAEVRRARAALANPR